MELVFASSNQNKIKEIASMLGEAFILKGLKDINCTVDIPETSGTIEGNAIQKAMYVYNNFDGIDCFSEDTGLEIKALNMRPGVKTARYAGPEKDADANMDKVLLELGDKKNREARFRTVIAYIKNGNIETFEGIAEGTISFERMGNKGFGYDPVFIPKGYETSFAQMDAEEKNKISHRAKAFQLFLKFIKNQQ